MPPPPRRPPTDAVRAAAPAFSERDIEDFQVELDRVPEPLEPLDVGMVDGFLCGVLLQPRPVPAQRWLRHIADADGCPLPAGFDAGRLQRFALRRHAELDAAIGQRQWFDPWVYELGAAAADADADADADTGAGALDPGATAQGAAAADDPDAAPTPIDAVLPWVAGFATALELFPELMAQGGERLTAPLALIYRHLGADDLEDADELLAEIDTLEPPADLAEAVEGLVRAVLLLADITRPASAAPGRPPRRGAPRRR